MMRKKLCWYCEYFRYENAERSWSEVTGGCSFDMRCSKEVWEFNPYLDSQEVFGKMMESAETCKYFEVKEDE